MKRIIVIMVVVWLVAMGLMLFSPTVRVRYWGWRLGRVETRVQQTYYASRLAWRADLALGVSGDLMGHPDPNVRLMAVHVIDRAAKPKADDLLLLALTDQEVRVRDAAALALGRRAGPELVSRLTEVAGGHDTGIAAAAVFALQRNASPRSVDAILRVLRTARSVEVRVQAIESLGLLGVERAEPLLARMLQDRRSVTTLPANERAVWRALAAHRDQLALSGVTVEGLSSDPDKTVADYAAEALRRIRRDLAAASQAAATRRSATRPGG